MNYNNNTPQFIRTPQDAAQFASSFDTLKAQASTLPDDQVFKKVKPPFKCKECRRKITMSEGYKVGKDKMCMRCVKTCLDRGFEKIRRAEAITGRKLLPDHLKLPWAEPLPPVN